MDKRSRQEQRLETRRFWEQQIPLWQQSGLSQKEYCRQNNLKDHQFTYWKKRLVPAADLKPVTFVQLQVGNVRSGYGISDRSAIRLNVGRDFQIEIDPGFDPDALRQLICVLDRA